MFCFTKVAGIIFDLDDTLVHANLDFKQMKQEIGCDEAMDILTYIEQIESYDERENARQTVLRHELEDAHTSELITGALDFILNAQQRGIPLAIVTRNCREASEIKIRNNNIPINLLITREDARPKPHPEGLLKIAKRWQLPSQKVAYIGDYIYDIEAAHNANMQAWLYKSSLKSIQYADNLSFVPKY